MYAVSRKRMVRTLRTKCPRGGRHDVWNVVWEWGPDGSAAPGRACVKCGLRDIYIEEEG